MSGGRRTVAAIVVACALTAAGGSAAGAAATACGNQNPLIRVCASISPSITYPGLSYSVGLGLNLDAAPTTCQQLAVTSRRRSPSGSVLKLDDGMHQACGAAGDPPTSPLFGSLLYYGEEPGTYAWKLSAKGPAEYQAPSSATVKIKFRPTPLPGNQCDTAENLVLCASGWILNPDNTFHSLPAQRGETMAVSVRVTDLGCACTGISLKVAVKRPDSTQFVPFNNIEHTVGGALERVLATVPADQTGTYTVRVNLAPNLGDFNLGPKVILQMEVLAQPFAHR